MQMANREIHVNEHYLIKTSDLKSSLYELLQIWDEKLIPKGTKTHSLFAI